MVVRDNQLDVADLLDQAREDFVAILGWRAAHVLLVDDNDRQICQLVFSDDVADCTREIVAT